MLRTVILILVLFAAFLAWFQFRTIVRITALEDIPLASSAYDNVEIGMLPKGTVAVLAGCKDTKSLIVPYVRLADGRYGYLTTYRFLVERTRDWTFSLVPFDDCPLS